MSRKTPPAAPKPLFSVGEDGTLSPRLPWRMRRGPLRKADGRTFFSLDQAARKFKVERAILVAHWLAACADLLRPGEAAAVRKLLRRRPRRTR